MPLELVVLLQYLHCCYLCIYNTVLLFSTANADDIVCVCVCVMGARCFVPNLFITRGFVPGPCVSYEC